MANTCFTDYTVVGSEDELKDLYDKMRGLEQLEKSLVENGWGKTWMGNLVTLFRGKVDGEDGIYCRGFWSNLDFDGSTLSFNTESAWSEMGDWRHFVESQYKTIKFWYMTEEEGEGYFLTNDKEGRYYPYRYVVDIEDGTYQEYSTEEEARAYIEERMGRKLESSEDPSEALSDWGDDHGLFAAYRIFEIEEDQA